MSIDEAQTNAAHANAVTWKVEYPPGAVFAEHHQLSMEQSRVPTKRYTDPAFLQTEIERVWKRAWQMACREEDIALRGDFVDYTIADQEWLVVRQADGTVKAFANACRHRGNMIKKGCGNANELRCQYHHWCWSLDGSLKEIPDRHLVNDVVDDDYALAEAACDTWGGFVFINPAGPVDAQPLLEYLGPVAEQLAPYHLDRMRAGMSISTDLACNWKVAVEAFLEVYHVQGIHPQLLPMLDDVNTAFELIGPHSRMIVPFGIPSMRLEHVDDLEVFESFSGQSGSTVANRASSPGGSGDGYKTTSVGGTAALEDLFDASGRFTGQSDIRQYLIEKTAEKGTELGHDYSGLSRDQMLDDWHYLIFPGLVFNTHAGGFLLFRLRPNATDPDRCWFDVWRFQWPDASLPLPAPAPNVWVPQGQGSFGAVLDQDFENLPRVQRGMHSDHLQFVTLTAQEVRVAHVHTAVDSFIN
jgi:choline monooxygenase